MKARGSKARGSKALVTAVAVMTLGTGAGIAWANGPGGHGRGAGFMDRAVLHGTFVRGLQSGGTETDDVQNGVITAVSATSVTVRSNDNYTATYVVDSSTDINFCGNADNSSAMATGDRVSVIALDNGDSATAKRIKDRGPAGADTSS